MSKFCWCWLLLTLPLQTKHFVSAASFGAKIEHSFALFSGRIIQGSNKWATFNTCAIFSHLIAVVWQCQLFAIRIQIKIQFYLFPILSHDRIERVCFRFGQWHCACIIVTACRETFMMRVLLEFMETSGRIISFQIDASTSTMLAHVACKSAILTPESMIRRNWEMISIRIDHGNDKIIEIFQCMSKNSVVHVGQYLLHKVTAATQCGPLFIKTINWNWLIWLMPQFISY